MGFITSFRISFSIACRNSIIHKILRNAFKVTEYFAGVLFQWNIWQLNHLKCFLLVFNILRFSFLKRKFSSLTTRSNSQYGFWKNLLEFHFQTHAEILLYTKCTDIYDIKTCISSYRVYHRCAIPMNNLTAELKCFLFLY